MEGGDGAGEEDAVIGELRAAEGEEGGRKTGVEPGERRGAEGFALFC